MGRAGRVHRACRAVGKLLLEEDKAESYSELHGREQLQFRFKLRSDKNSELIPATEILQQRDISFNESAVLPKETEEALLYREMQSDIVQQIMRRLATVSSDKI